MIEIVNSKNSIDVKHANAFAQELSFKLLLFNSKASVTKLSASKVNNYAKRIKDWLLSVNDAEVFHNKVNCLELSFSILERNARIDAQINEDFSYEKINKSSIFSHAEKLLAFRMEGE